MTFLFRSGKDKTPQEVVDTFVEQLKVMCANDGRKQKASEEAEKSLEAIKHVLFGDNEHEPDPGECRHLCEAVFNSAFISLLVVNLANLSFEARKSAAHVFKYVMKSRGEGQNAGVDYVLAHPTVIPTLVKGYDSPDIALMSGSMLRECLKHEALAKALLESAEFAEFFRLVELPNFDVASDAFVTFRDLLTRHKSMCAKFLDSNYDQVFGAYQGLLNSSNYVTRRQSLKLLGELLLDRKNFAIMTRFIASTDNLKLMMNLLRDKSKSIQFEAFHVFKVFVANPHKPDPIKQILARNKDKLVKYLSTFQEDREDEQFKEEKAFLIREVSSLSE